MCKMGIDLPSAGLVYRTLGNSSPWSRIGCGVIDKRDKPRVDTRWSLPTYSVIWVFGGSGTYIDHRQVFPFKQGDCFHRWPGRSHTTIPDESGGWVEWFVDSGIGIHEGFVDAGFIEYEPVVWRPSHIPHNELESLRKSLMDASKGELPLLTVEVLRLIAQSRQPILYDAQTDLIEQACQLLTSKHMGRIGIRDWCEDNGMSYESFRKLFTQKMGEPPGQYVIRRRMERACALLIGSSQSIKSISEDLGYASPYEFSAQFRRRHGISPSLYRQKCLIRYWEKQLLLGRQL